MRLIALLLAVMMMTGTASEVYAAPDLVSVIDDAADLTMLRAEPVAVARPAHRPPAQIEAPRASTRGRVHAVLIFRPPRVIASR